ncbi:MAG: hypothetical protein IJ111_00805 [Eggerthellaceae bacterium]|nr:hypothetical protein [Eggerthellaceae bacterium]
MGTEEANSSLSISSMEMLAMGGFALFFGWMFIVFYWLFCEFPPGVDVVTRDVTQLFAFAAIPVGYVIMHFSAKRAQFNIFTNKARILLAIGASILPAIALVMYQGVNIPLAVVCVANVIVGLVAAGIRTAWLDVCSRLKDDYYSRFTGLSLFAGGLLFVLVAFLPATAQPIFAIVYILLSVGLLAYVSPRIEGNADRVPLETVAETWRFAKEIEPSFFMFGVVFAITVVFLFNSGSEQVLLGLIATLVGSLAIALLSIGGKQLSITIYQRILVVITVLACILTPFLQGTGQLVCACVVMASMSMFMAINYSYLVKKCAVAREAPLFRQAPIRLFVPSLGFAAGWALATVFTALYGPHSDAFMYMRLGVAIVLVVVVMVFIPVKEHHAVDGSSPSGERVTKTVVTVDRSESDLFEARCAAVAKLYQLSPRESEIFAYLAKGRNAAYIQEELVISPHTVKSHIYNIYRKLDIHSQQKLMDFVEEFPLDD